MNITETLYVKSGVEWRQWLEKNHKNKKEIWLVFYKKHTGKPRISDEDALEEALCYGWIDGIQKRIDDEKYARRFTPRKPASKLSEMNKEYIRKLVKEGKMTAFGFNAVSKFFDKSKDQDDKLTIAPDILKLLKADEHAWENFQNFSESYKRVRIGYIENRRGRDEMFQKSLLHFIKMTAKNKKFGRIK